MFDSLPETTRGWRTANRFGCVFAVSAVVSALWLLLAAVGSEGMRPGGWWVCGGFTAVGVAGAAICFWIRTRTAG